MNEPMAGPAAKPQPSRHIFGFITLLLIAGGAAFFALYFPQARQAYLLKIFVIVFASLLPAWLYFQFLRTRARAIWDEYVFSLARLGVAEYASGPGAYKEKFESLFGPVPAENRSVWTALRGESFFPVAVGTLAISAGWALAVQPELLPDTLRYGFLGAYFYILQMLVRRFFQNDLKPVAYIQATVRLAATLILVWILNILPETAMGEQGRCVLAFIIGIFPDLAWQAVKTLVQWPAAWILPSLRHSHPLSDLVGLNIWYEARLLEEGIEDMQNLATANLADLMLNTRIPVDRLVDWIDQSLLCLHLAKGNSKNRDADREKLQRFGIRTASDLHDVLYAPDGRYSEFQLQLAGILNTGTEKPGVLLSILAALKNDPNFNHVLQWRSFDADRQASAMRPDED